MTTEHVETVEIASARGLLNRTIGEYRDGACEITAVNRAVMVLIAAVRAESEAEIASLQELNTRMVRLMRDWVAQYDHESGCGVSWGDPPETCVCLLGRARAILTDLNGVIDAT